MSIAQTTALLLLCGGAFYVLARLVYRVAGAVVAVDRASRQSVRELAAHLADVKTPELRRRLVEDPYLAQDLGGDAEVRRFVERVEAGDEVALAREFPRDRLHSLFATAELRTGGKGRPEAVDAVGELSALLQELASRAEG